MTRIPSGHALFLWTYKTNKYIIAVEIDDTLMATHNRIFLEKLIKEFYFQFDYTLQK